MDNHVLATRRGVTRARWLGELAQALEAAGRLSLQIGGSGSGPSELVKLGAQIAALQREVGAIRRGVPLAMARVNPNWMS